MSGRGAGSAHPLEKSANISRIQAYIAYLLGNKFLRTTSP
jgi:hypothetical protein